MDLYFWKKKECENNDEPMWPPNLSKDRYMTIPSGRIDLIWDLACIKLRETSSTFSLLQVKSLLMMWFFLAIFSGGIGFYFKLDERSSENGVFFLCGVGLLLGLFFLLKNIKPLEFYTEGKEPKRILTEKGLSLEHKITMFNLIEEYQNRISKNNIANEKMADNLERGIKSVIISFLVTFLYILFLGYI